MAHRDPAFSEVEKVNLLAEIIKCSRIPHLELANIILDHQIQPPWLEVRRPPGRSTHECQAVFEEIKDAVARHRSTMSYAGSYRQSFPPSYPQRPPYPAMEAPQPGPPYVGGRTIVPRPQAPPSQILTAAQPPPSASYASTPTSATERPHSQRFLQEQEQTPPKKRGRPSNAELEQKKREYAERGEPYPPPRSRKRSRPGGMGSGGGVGRGASGGQGPTSSRPSESPQTTQTPSSSTSLPGTAPGASGVAIPSSIEEGSAAKAKVSPTQRPEMFQPGVSDRAFTATAAPAPSSRPQSLQSPPRERQFLPPPPPSTSGPPTSSPRGVAGEQRSPSAAESSVQPSLQGSYQQRILPPIPQTPYPTPHRPQSHSRQNGSEKDDNGRGEGGSQL